MSFSEFFEKAFDAFHAFVFCFLNEKFSHFSGRVGLVGKDLEIAQKWYGIAVEEEKSFKIVGGLELLGPLTISDLDTT